MNVSREFEAAEERALEEQGKRMQQEEALEEILSNPNLTDAERRRWKCPDWKCDSCRERNFCYEKGEE